MSVPPPYSTFSPTVVPPASRTGARVLSGLAGLVLTPVALGLLGYGGYRQQNVLSTYAAHSDAVSVVLLVAGALLLLAVATLGAWSSAGPLLGGLLWGVLPGLVTLAMPQWGLELLNLVPWGQLRFGVATWLFTGALFGCGFLLVGTGLAGSLVRRRREPHAR
ncbi:hypothetical protein [Amycolatopsis panacis]|uniref:hypothetical protein n=1 Tax=Amycolatopsis panacis TaxID=2340917 RepID=UPI001F292EEE|nr:hypothetical protein [Amycolatopsis panacis]